MEWGVKENHVAVIALHKCRISHSQIFELLKIIENSVNVCWAIKHYKELWRVEDRAQTGRLRSVRTEAPIRTVQERICQNPLQKQKIMSQKLNILAHYMSCLVRDDLNMRAYRQSEGLLLTPTLKEI
jgi:hypothetical protein